MPRPGFTIPVSAPKGGGVSVEWLNQAKEIHKEFGRYGLLKFVRMTEERDGAAEGSYDVLLPLFGEKE